MYVYITIHEPKKKEPSSNVKPKRILGQVKAKEETNQELKMESRMIGDNHVRFGGRQNKQLN